MFRQKALDKIASPEELDRLLVIVKRPAWLPLLTLGLLCGAGLCWAVLGRIPISVNGIGVLINPGNVRGIQSAASGQITELRIRVGQSVEKGDVIAVLNQPEIRKQLQQAQAELKERRESQQAASEAEEQRRELQSSSDLAQRTLLLEEIQKAEELAESIRSKSDAFNQVQRKNLEKTRDLSVRLNETLKNRYDTLKKLKAEGLSSGDVVLSAEVSYMDSQMKLADLDVQLRQIALREIESEQNYLAQQNRIADLRLQLKQIEINQQRLREEILESRLAREAEIRELERKIDALNLNLERQGAVHSEHTGRVLEITVSAGQIISPGDRLGAIELTDAGGELKNLAYFAVQDGKRIRPGMKVQVTPATVQRERYGGIVGTVTSVSSFPITREGAANIVGNREVAAALTRDGGMIEVEAELARDVDSPSGYLWTSQGPPVKFSAGTTTTVRITVEERAPITYVLPILRTWIYGANDEVSREE